MERRKIEIAKSSKGNVTLYVTEFTRENDNRTGNIVYEQLEIEETNDFVVGVRLPWNYDQDCYSLEKKAVSQLDNPGDITGTFRSIYGDAQNTEITYGLKCGAGCPKQNIHYIRQFCEVLEDVCVFCETQLPKILEDWNNGWDGWKE